MDLFEQKHRELSARQQPLAARMRPRTLEEYVGQQHILAPGRLLYRAIRADQVSSLIFYGPPGTGKTSLAAVIANTTRSLFVTINAVLAGVKEIRAAIDAATERMTYHGRRTILFVDEVHRWNKAQQDALLPWVENGTIILIGATIENPFFEVNRALVSRSRIFQLTPLDRDELRLIVEQALADPERGYGSFEVRIDEDALEHLIDVSGGDARSLLNALELAVETTPDRFPPDPSKAIHIDMSVAEQSIQRRAVLYDKEGDYHFDTISAFIKSLRGSDPDAAVYWMAKMVHAGEDPHFLFRRMLIFASEDVGMADPNALVITQAAAAAFDRVGMPEGRFHMAHAALYLATAPKSNSAFAFFDALKTVEQEQADDVPLHLRDANRDKKGFGHGKGYLYPHAYDEHWVAQQYLPDSLQGRIFYNPGELGYEARIKPTVDRRREAQLAVADELGGESGEVLTFSPVDRVREQWLARASGDLSRHLSAVRDRLFDMVPVSRHWLVLDMNARHGLFTWEALRRAPEGGVWSVVEEGRGERVKDQAARLPELERPTVLEGDLSRVHDMVDGRAGGADAGGNAPRFDLAIGRNTLGPCSDRLEVLGALHGVLRTGGWLAVVEAVPRRGQRLSEFLEPSTGSTVCTGSTDPPVLSPGITGRIREAEQSLFSDPENPRVSWDEGTLETLMREAGFEDVRTEHEDFLLERKVRSIDLDQWLGSSSSYARALRSVLTDTEMEQVLRALRGALEETLVSWRRSVLYLVARKPGGSSSTRRRSGARRGGKTGQGGGTQHGGKGGTDAR